MHAGFNLTWGIPPVLVRVLGASPTPKPARHLRVLVTLP
jgi:hypothetical protein